MKLKVGDIVEFKNYADMTNEEHMMIGKDSFPASGTVRKVFNNFDFFCIEGSLYAFNVKSIARVISDVDVNVINNLNVGDEVLAKVTVKGIFANGIRISSQIKTSNVIKILKRKEPEYFIVKEDYYGMYIGVSGELVGSKDTAQVFTSHDDANKEAENMHLNYWKVLPYDD